MFIKVCENKKPELLVVITKAIENCTVLKTLIEIAKDNKMEFAEFNCDIYGTTIEEFKQFISIVNKVYGVISEIRNEIMKKVKEHHETLKKTIADRKARTMQEIPELKELPPKTLNIELQKIANEKFNVPNYFRVPKTLEQLYIEQLKYYIHMNLHESELFKEYEQIGKPLVRIINLSNKLGAEEACIHMGAFLIYSYVENPEKFNQVYEGGKKYDPNEIFYKSDKENPSEEELLELKERNAAYHAELVEHMKVLKLMREHAFWKK